MKADALAKKLAADVGAVLKKYLGDFRTEFEKKLADAIAALPAPEKGEKGEKGDKGDDGVVNMEALGQLIKDAVASVEIPKGEKGDKGDSVDMEALEASIAETIKATVAEQVKEIVLPAGEKGDKGDAGEVDMQAVKEIIAEEVAKIELPIPEKGDPGEKGDKGDAASIDMEEVKRMIAEAVKAIELPEPKSAVDIEIEDGIDVEKVYARGTYARHKGGLWRSFERTKGMKGWECIVAGVESIAVDYDGERTISITIAQSDGDPVVKQFAVPVMIDKGVWTAEGEYLKGDTVTLAGAIWVSQKDAPAGRPGISTDWRLAVKRGGTGKSAFDLAREAGFTGDRMAWLDSLGKKPTVKIEP